MQNLAQRIAKENTKRIASHAFAAPLQPTGERWERKGSRVTDKHLTL